METGEPCFTGLPSSAQAQTHLHRPTLTPTSTGALGKQEGPEGGAWLRPCVGVGGLR